MTFLTMKQNGYIFRGRQRKKMDARKERGNVDKGTKDHAGLLKSVLRLPIYFLKNLYGITIYFLNV